MLFKWLKKLFGKGDSQVADSVKGSKGAKGDGTVLLSPIQGEAVSISKVSDPTFGEEILGKGIAIIPQVGKVYAPADGTIEIMFDTKHAVSMTTDDGVEVLIHIGLDTVSLKGEHFTSHVRAGKKVNAGDLLVEFDVEAIKKAGFDVITPIVICNTNDYSSIRTFENSSVSVGDKILEISK